MSDKCLVCGGEQYNTFGDRRMVELPQGIAHADCFSAVWDAVWRGEDRSKTIGQIKQEVGETMRAIHESD